MKVRNVLEYDLCACDLWALTRISGRKILLGGVLLLSCMLWILPLNAQIDPGRRVIVSESCVRIQALHSGKLLAIVGNGRGEGKNVHQWEERNLDHFEWQIEPIGNREHKIINRRSGKVLTVAARGEDSTANVFQESWEKKALQIWYFEEVNQGTFFIRSKKEGLYLEVERENEGNGANVRVHKLSGERNQIFRLKPEACSNCENLEPISFASFSASEGWVKTDFVRVHKGDFVSLSGWSSERGMAFPPAEWEWRGPNGFYSGTRTALISRKIQEEQAGVYTAVVRYGHCVKELHIKLHVAEETGPVEATKQVAINPICTGIQSASTQKYLAPSLQGKIVQEELSQWNVSANPHLDWRVEYMGNNEHRIVHKASSKVLAIGEEISTLRTKVTSVEWKGSDEQRWYLEYPLETVSDLASSGQFYLKNKANGLYLEVRTQNSGPEIFTVPFQGDGSQGFFFRTDQCNSSSCGANILEVEFNALSGAADLEIIDNKIYFESELPQEANIEALVEGGGESVEFILEGPKNLTHVENKSPYRFQGNRAPLSLPTGSYTLTLNVYSKDDAKGELCDRQELSFEIAKDPPLSELNAGTLKPEIRGPIYTCKIGQFIRISAIPKGLQVPKDFEVVYLLSDGDSMVQQINKRSPEFFIEQPRKGTYRIHSLVYKPQDLDISTLEIGKTSPSEFQDEARNQGELLAVDLEGALFEFLNCGSIGGVVFEDQNMNGIREGGERVLAGQIVSLLDANKAKLLTVYTDDQGAYQFGNLVGGNYLVRVLPPAGRRFTQQDVGEENFDSDVNPRSGFSDLIGLEDGQKQVDVGAGVIPATDCAAEVGTLRPLQTSPLKWCELGGSISVSAEPSGQVLPNENYFVFYLLSSGEDLVIEQIDNIPEFSVTPRATTFRIHPLVASLNPADSNFFNLGKIILQVTTLEDILGRIQETGVCAGFDQAGAAIIIEACEGQDQGRFNLANTDLAEFEQNSAEEIVVEVFPNPAYYQIQVQLESNSYNSLPLMEVSLFDMQGNQLHYQLDSDGYLGIDISSLTAGIYLIQVLAGEKQFIERFIKE